MLTLSRKLNEEVALVNPQGEVTRLKVVAILRSGVALKANGPELLATLNMEVDEWPKQLGLGGWATTKIVLADLRKHSCYLSFDALRDVAIYRTPEMEATVLEVSRQRRGVARTA